MLERMFDEHGNTVSQQYGGSNVVHTIQSYRDNRLALGSKAQNIKRYYSNTLSDSDKQNIINLFLGVYRYVNVTLSSN